jgi:hypothetical protein
LPDLSLNVGWRLLLVGLRWWLRLRSYDK